MKEHKCRQCGRVYLNKFGLIAHQNKILCPAGCKKKFSVWGITERVVYHLRKEHNWNYKQAKQACESIEQNWRKKYQLARSY